jgi:hypothetical protein
MAILLNPGVYDLPFSMIPVDPFGVTIGADTAMKATSLADVDKFSVKLSRHISIEVASRYFIFEKNFNPNSNLRGISPVLSGLSEIGTYYESSKYTKAFFENSAIPSHMIILPEGITKKRRDSFLDQYTSLYTGGNNAHKIVVVEGGKNKVGIESIGKDVSDLNLSEIKGYSVDQIMSLFGIPPLIAGIYSKTRFDSAAEELQQYLDFTLMPLSKTISEMLQRQLVDPFDWSSDIKTETKSLSKSLTRRITNLREDNNSNPSNITILLDLDANPITARLRRELITLAGELRESLLLSPSEAAEYVGVDLPDNPLRNDIWIPSNIVNISNVNNSNPITNEDKSLEDKSKEAKSKEAKSKEVESKEAKTLYTSEDIAVAKKISRNFFTLRKFFADRIINKESFTLSDIDKTFKKDDLILIKEPSRQLYIKIKDYIKKNEDKDNQLNFIKSIFNFKKSYFKALASKINHNNKE